MTRRHYEPLTVLNEFNKLFDLPLRRFGVGEDNSNVETSNWMPAVDIKEDANQFTITADLPGVPKENIHVAMENGLLTIKGERREEHKEEVDNLIRTEITRGSFYRRFTLPETADGAKIRANMKNGVLDVKIPKKEIAQARQIQIEDSE